MSFHQSADISSLKVNDGRLLLGRLRDNNGNFQHSAIDLNWILSNNDGHFQWGGERYTATSRDVTFGMEGGGNVPILRAQLKNISGAWVSADLNLGERIKNVDGQFKFE
ncbi:Cyanovirin-N [Ceratobasidium sp. AG-I]|nr:Cyanovirin-N [Ceratobasidium sp. AG-I]